MNVCMRLRQMNMEPTAGLWHYFADFRLCVEPGCLIFPS
jgi:hypothetical protein